MHTAWVPKQQQTLAGHDVAVPSGKGGGQGKLCRRICAATHTIPCMLRHTTPPYGTAHHSLSSQGHHAHMLCTPTSSRDQNLRMSCITENHHHHHHHHHHHQVVRIAVKIAIMHRPPSFWHAGCTSVPAEAMLASVLSRGLVWRQLHLLLGAQHLLL